jgi:hypothetical protein
VLNKEQVEAIVKRCENLTSENANWRSYHQALAEFVLPRKGWINTIKTKGERIKLGSVFDSTAIRGLQIMASGFSSHLTNPASKWFGWQTRNLALMKDKEVQTWCKDVEDAMFAVLGSSNFDTSMQEFYTDLGAFGTATLLIEDDIEEKVRFTVVPIEQVEFEEDSKGRVNRLYRTYKYTIQQAYDLWGNAIGPDMLAKLKEKPNEKIDFIYAITPRYQREAGKDDSVNMPYLGAWIEKKEKRLIKEGGFYEAPFAVGRFYHSEGESFGMSPAMVALAEIGLVNAQVRTMLRAAMKQADPAYILPGKGFILPLNANPGAMNYRDPKTTTKDDLSTLPSNGNIPITLEVIRMVQENIEKAFFVPLFQAFSQITKQMTIPEVQRRISENMVLLGPVVGRTTQETFDPTLKRLFNMLYRNGDLPEPPAVILDGQEDIDLVYTSTLARAQRETEVTTLESFLVDVQAIGSVIPSVVDKIDGDEVIEIIARVKGVDPTVIRDDKLVQEIRQQRAQAEQMQAQLMMAQGGADVVKTGAEANKIMQPGAKA